MQMKCDKLMQDALNLHIDPEARAALNAMRKPAISGYTPKEGVGIDINSKLETALEKIRKQSPMGKSGFNFPYMDKESLYKKLIKEGVSRKEIAFGLEGMLEKTSISDRDKKLLKILSAEERRKLGIGNKDSDKVFLDKVQDKAESTRPKIEKISSDYNAYTYNLQGQNNPTYAVRGLKLPNSKKIGSPGHFPEKGLIGWSRSYIGTQPGIDGKVLRLDEFQSDWAQNPGLKKDIGELPIDHNDFKKIMIVDGIDRAIKNNLDTIVIPITRTSNNLAGTKEVSQNYLDLQKGILPKIRQELDRAGLKLDVKKVSKKSDNIDYNTFETKLMEMDGLDEFTRDSFRNLVDDVADDYGYTKDTLKKALSTIRDRGDRLHIHSIKKIEEQIEKATFSEEEAWVLKVSDKSGKLLFNNIKEANRGKFGEAQGPLLKELKAKLYSRTKSIDELPEDARVMLPYLDELSDTTIDTFFPEYSKTGFTTPRQIKALLADPEVNARESEDILQDIRRATKYKEHVLDKKGSAHNLDSIQDNLSLGDTEESYIKNGLDEYEYYRNQFSDFPEFYKATAVPNGKKYRWDALSVAGTLGLGEAYSKLQEQAN